MMLPTHALVGMALAFPVALLAPEFTADAVVAGLVGGVFPDLDMYAGHRRTLHYPVYYSAIGLAAIAVAVWFPTAATVGVAVFLSGAAIHSLTDVLGSGLELRPWEGRSDRAVYDHYHGRWIAPRRRIAYDGSPGDLLAAVALGIPLLLTLESRFRWAVAVILFVAGVYTAVRRRLPAIAERLVCGLEAMSAEEVLRYVPDRYRDEPTTGRHG